MRLEQDVKLDFDDVLIRPKRSALASRKEVDLERAYKFKHSHREWKGTPIIAANMDASGTFAMAEAFSKHKMLVAFHKYYDVEEIAEFYNLHSRDYLDNVFYTLGISDIDLDKLKQVLSMVSDREKLHNICIDVANGYNETFLQSVKKMRTEYPDKTIMAGNVVTGEMTEALILAGADIIKIGIGPGSSCITRKVAGVGYPQLSAVMECADSAHGLGAQICSDGGCVNPGDVAKAFGAGADFVMIGGMFAGYDESGGDVIEKDGEKFKLFYGSSSDTAMKKHNGGVHAYKASEGRTVAIPYRGAVDIAIQNILGGLRSACTYVGASRLKDFSKCTTFVRVNKQYNDVFEK